MKRISLILFFMLIVFLPLEVKALSVSENNLTIVKGENKSIDLYADVDSEITEVNFSLIYTSYDVPAYFNIESGLRDENTGIKHKIVFSVPVTGKIKLGTVNINVVNNPKVTAGVVNVHSASAVTASGETISLDTQIINVTVGKDTTELVVVPNTDDNDNKIVNKNLLSKIESQIAKIDLKDDVYEYTVKVKEDIQELDLKPVAKDSKYEVSISNQKIAELEKNQIIITVKDGDNIEEYKIKVNVMKTQEKVEIDNEEFEPTFKYKGKWVTLIVIFGITLFVGLLFVKKQ